MCLSYCTLHSICNLHPYCISLSHCECRKQTKCSVALTWLLPHFKKRYWVSGRRHHRVAFELRLCRRETRTSLKHEHSQKTSLFSGLWLALAKRTPLLKSGPAFLSPLSSAGAVLGLLVVGWSALSVSAKTLHFAHSPAESSSVVGSLNNASRRRSSSDSGVCENVQLSRRLTFERKTKNNKQTKKKLVNQFRLMRCKIHCLPAWPDFDLIERGLIEHGLSSAVAAAAAAAGATSKRLLRGSRGKWCNDAPSEKCNWNKRFVGEGHCTQQ